jgi:hypothetical protein
MESQPKLVRLIPRTRFPKNLKPRVGKRLTAVHGLPAVADA